MPDNFSDSSQCNPNCQNTTATEKAPKKNKSYSTRAATTAKRKTKRRRSRSRRKETTFLRNMLLAEKKRNFPFLTLHVTQCKWNTRLEAIGLNCFQSFSIKIHYRTDGPPWDALEHQLGYLQSGCHLLISLAYHSPGLGVRSGHSVFVSTLAHTERHNKAALKNIYSTQVQFKCWAKSAICPPMSKSSSDFNSVLQAVRQPVRQNEGPEKNTHTYGKKMPLNIKKNDTKCFFFISVFVLGIFHLKATAKLMSMSTSIASRVGVSDDRDMGYVNRFWLLGTHRVSSRLDFNFSFNFNVHLD